MEKSYLLLYQKTVGFVNVDYDRTNQRMTLLSTCFGVGGKSSQKQWIQNFAWDLEQTFEYLMSMEKAETSKFVSLLVPKIESLEGGQKYDYIAGSCA